MLVLRLGSTCSMQISSNMPPHKKIKSEYGFTEIVNVESSESDPEEPVVRYGSDWRDHCQSLREKYSYTLKNNVLTDVKLIVGEKGVPFNCHRLILAIGSPVFEAMFYGELAETGDSVTIPDVDPEGFRHLLRFLYTGQYDEPHDETAFKTYFAADKYCVSELKKRCENCLCCCDVSPMNVWLFYENSLLLNSEAIKKRCLQVLKHQLKSALEQSAFLEISFNTMESLLSLDDLNVSEEKLLKNVILWAEHQSDMEGADSFENTLKPLLSNIRFSALTAEEFVHLRHHSRLPEVLNVHDSLTILEHLIHPNLCELPRWCSSKKRLYVAPPPERVTFSPYPARSSASTSRRRKSKRKSEDPSPSAPFVYSSASSSLTTTSTDSSSSSSESSD